MIDLLLKDNVNKKMQKMCFLTERFERVLYNDLFELNKKGYNLSVEDLTSETIQFWEQKGFEMDSALLDNINIALSKLLCKSC